MNRLIRQRLVRYRCKHSVPRDDHMNRSTNSSHSNHSNQVVKYELDNPHLWFPQTREYGQRHFILHCGPTNSGKTYTALRHLATARRGLYAGPLRILCNEVREKMIDNYQVSCNLITGNEKVIAEDATHTR